MKILQINKYHFIKGGADRVYFNTVNLLEKNGHEVISFSTSHPDNLESRFSDFFVPYIEYRKNGFVSNILSAGRYIYNKSAYKILNSLLDVYKPDIAHLHLFYGDLSASILKSLRERKIPVVLSVHDYRLICPANSLLDSCSNICERCRNKAYYQCLTNRCLEGNFFYSGVLALEGYVRKYWIDSLDYIDRFIFVSSFAQQKHIEFDNRFSAKSSQLYNFTDVESYSPASEKGDYFLFFGRLVKEKGLTTLLNAVKDLDVKLMIAGAGPLEEEVINLSEKHRNITFLGYQSGGKLKELIRRATFIVVPSEWYENNPMTIIEAYSMGIPVIGARIGGIPEIVIDNKTGFLFESRNERDLADAIRKASQIGSLKYTEMSAAAAAYAHSNFSSGDHYNKLMEIYTEVRQNV